MNQYLIHIFRKLDAEIKARLPLEKRKQTTAKLVEISEAGGNKRVRDAWGPGHLRQCHPQFKKISFLNFCMFNLKSNWSSIYIDKCYFYSTWNKWMTHTLLLFTGTDILVIMCVCVRKCLRMIQVSILKDGTEWESVKTHREKRRKNCYRNM